MHGVEKEVSSTTGVKQGDLLGPDLFNIHIAAVMQIWRARYNGTKCTFRTKQDFVLGTGTRGNTRKWDLGGKRGRSSGVEEFEVSDSEYADDTALIFSSRGELEHWSPLPITMVQLLLIVEWKFTLSNLVMRKKQKLLFCLLLCRGVSMIGTTLSRVGEKQWVVQIYLT